MIKIVLFFACVFALQHVGESISCYVCNGCAEPFNSTGIMTSPSCTVCKKKFLNAPVIGKTVTKTCEASCTPINAMVAGYGYTDSCCETDLCNFSSRMTASLGGIFLSVLSALFTAFIKFF